MYHPYVYALEQEIELRALRLNGPSSETDDLQLYRFAYGRALGDYWFGEVYLLGEKAEGYRYSRTLEPAIELYKGEDTFALGPVLMGTLNAGARRKLHWEAGALIGLDSTTPDTTLRLLLEYEF